MAYDTPADKLLGAWLDATAVIKKERFMKNLTFNEAFVCYLLDRRRLEAPSDPSLSLMYIQKRMNLLKSQLNKIVNDLESKEYIIRNRCETDKRLVFVTLTQKGLDSYHKEHRRIIAIVNIIADDLGAEKTRQTIDIIHALTHCAEETLKEETKK